MTIEVLLFSTLREAVGASSVRVEVPDGATARDVALTLYRDHDMPGREAASARYAVNEAFVPDEHALRDGDRLAIILPVSGG